MSDDEATIADDCTELEHDSFLQKVTTGTVKKPKLRHSLTTSAADHTGGNGQVSIGDLLLSLKDTPTLNKLKTKLSVSKQRAKVLDRPLHRLASDKVLRGAAYEKAKKQVSKWQGVVHENRLADQQFPLNQVVCRDRTVAEATSQFVPRTSLERKTAEILKNSRHNLSNDVELTIAEKEALKAMSLQEAQERRQELQKMRALISYQEAKLKRQKKIKSKGYHRILKKQKRKQMMIDFEALKEKDPEAAAERMDMLRKDRVEERMTLKHRSGNRWSKEIMRHAKRDPVVRKMVEEQLNLGRELRAKQPDDEQSEASSEEEDASGTTDKRPSIRLDKNQQAAEEEDLMMVDPKNPWITAGLAKIRSDSGLKVHGVNETSFAQLKQADYAQRGILKKVPPLPPTGSSSDLADKNSLVSRRVSINLQAEEPELVSEKSVSSPTGDNATSAIVADDSPLDPNAGSEDPTLECPQSEPGVTRSRKRKSRRNRKTTRTESDNDVSVYPESSSDHQQYNSADESSSKEADSANKSPPDQPATPEIRRNQLAVLDLDDILPSSSNDDEDDEKTGSLSKNDQPKSRKAKRKRLSANERRQGQAESVRSKPESSTVREPVAQDVVGGTPFTSLMTPSLPSLVMESMNEVMDVDDSQAALVAEAFADDDIVEDFEKEKQEIEDKDKPKDLDLNLPGWGSWAGAGIAESRNKKQRFIIKAPEAPPRKDKFKPGLIISESDNPSAKKLQVNELPFPFKSVAEFERSLRHPLGREWNPPSAFASLVAPNVVKKRGAVIRPINRDLLKTGGRTAEFEGNDYESI